MKTTTTTVAPTVQLTEGAVLRPGDAYRARERAVLAQMAIATIADTKTGTEEKRAARARLKHRDESQYDWDHLSLDELKVVRELLARARGTGRDSSPVDAQAWALAKFAQHAQNVADAARAELERAVGADAARAHERRCASCGRYDEVPDAALVGLPIPK